MMSRRGGWQQCRQQSLRTLVSITTATPKYHACQLIGPASPGELNEDGSGRTFESGGDMPGEQDIEVGKGQVLLAHRKMPNERRRKNRGAGKTHRAATRC